MDVTTDLFYIKKTIAKLSKYLFYYPKLYNNRNDSLLGCLRNGVQQCHHLRISQHLR